MDYLKEKSERFDINTDYKLSYYNNVNAGSQAGVTVQGIGEYTGGKSKTFTIKKLKITDAEYHVEKYNSNNFYLIFLIIISILEYL